MAADTRQFADHFELDGSNVYVEDKKLGELKDKTAVTTIDATNQFIPLQDVDGNIQKISKSSFTDAVRNVLGDLLINNDKGVSISGIPALSGSGSSLDFGSVSPANLASVLGVVGSGAAPNDANSLTKTGIYGIYGGTLNVYTGAGMIIVATKGQYIEQSQIWSDGSKANVAYRIFDGSNWSAWVS